MFTSALTEHKSLFGHIFAWWHDLRRRHAEMNSLEASGEMEALAQDAGLSASDLRRLLGGSSDAAELKRRMAALGLDPACLSDWEPAVARDLQRTCSFCISKRRCRQDLATRPTDQIWQEYCPNSSTLNALRGQS